ncbi:unnamed protein product [Zymoseptoria tritici ST99CH_1E4]|uniref:Major facilitator superfamily (MFS) profile domain-containing protein n=1 Tax=Zymoseptoria tritici ST99CH_1E4 TaxID=1276532 RepID=A0A2H1GA95_ZYMTR|nr:unnamed protein product [Zymoseptoria tritici ST99CH_1E4]
MSPQLILRGRWLHAAIWIEGLVAVTMFGYCAASAGGVLNMSSFQSQFEAIDVANAPESEKQHTSTIQGTVVAVYTLFGIVGALVGGTFLGDLLGRRKSIFLAATLQLLGAILMGTSYSLAQLIIGRVFTGLGVGAIVAAVPVWQSELSEAENRGWQIASISISSGIGLMAAQWLAFAMSFVDGSIAWRLTLSGSGLISIFVMATIFVLPESPRWLKLKGRGDEARQILEMLLEEPEDVDKSIADIEQALRISASQAGLKDLFSMGPQRNLHRMLLACGVQVMLQFTGVNALIFYTQTIYETNLGFSPVKAGILSATSPVFMVLGGLATAGAVDKYGRRALMMFSAAGMAVCFAFVIGLIALGTPTALIASVAFLYIYYLVYTIGFIGIPFMYASEIAPVQLRAAICGVSVAVSWICSYIVVQITPLGIAAMKSNFFIVWLILNASFVPIVYYFYPETAGRSLEEIDAIFEQSKSCLDSVRIAKTMPLMRSSTPDPEMAVHVTKHVVEKV